MSPSIIKLFNLVDRLSSDNTSLDSERSIIVMCSGGVDSVAALHYFAKKNLSNLRVNGYHFNHKIRPQNDVMMERVQALCDQLRVPLLSASAKKQLNTEAEYREARMLPLRDRRDSIIITGHHLNDCVESYLLNCLRGHQGYLPIPFIPSLRNKKTPSLPTPSFSLQKKS